MALSLRGWLILWALPALSLSIGDVATKFRFLTMSLFACYMLVVLARRHWTMAGLGYLVGSTSLPLCVPIIGAPPEFEFFPIGLWVAPLALLLTAQLGLGAGLGAVGLNLVGYSILTAVAAATPNTHANAGLLAGWFFLPSTALARGYLRKLAREQGRPRLAYYLNAVGLLLIVVVTGAIAVHLLCQPLAPPLTSGTSAR